MNAPAAESAREPAVAGLFYPDARSALESAVDSLLDAARADTTQSVAPVKVMIVPHAGYVYSGPVAAHAYAHLAPVAQRIRRVVLLGPAHRAYVRGLALPSAQSFRTPLGDVALDLDGVRAASQFPQVAMNEQAHAREHSIEVHLPFLQRTLRDFALVPLVVGDATPTEVAQVLEALWGGEETLIVISTDLSHYQPYDTAKIVDKNTVDAIVHKRFVNHEQACGAHAINGITALRAWRELTPTLLDLRSSGDIVGSRNEVVGYVSIVMSEGADR